MRKGAKLVEVPENRDPRWRRWKVFGSRIGEELGKEEYQEEKGEKVEEIH